VEQKTELGASCQHSVYVEGLFPMADTSEFWFDKSFFYKSFINNQKAIDTVLYKIDSIVSKKYYKENDAWFYTKDVYTNCRCVFILSKQQHYTSIDQFYFYSDVSIIRGIYFMNCKHYLLSQT
jgi:hypothetical protein